MLVSAAALLRAAAMGVTGATWGLRGPSKGRLSTPTEPVPTVLRTGAPPPIVGVTLAPHGGEGPPHRFRAQPAPRCEMFKRGRPRCRDSGRCFRASTRAGLVWRACGRREDGCSTVCSGRGPSRVRNGWIPDLRRGPIERQGCAVSGRRPQHRAAVVVWRDRPNCRLALRQKISSRCGAVRSSWLTNLMCSAGLIGTGP
jgi:hypothetical protein